MSHLQFVDGTNFFSNDLIENVSNLKLILESPQSGCNPQD